MEPGPRSCGGRGYMSSMPERQTEKLKALYLYLGGSLMSLALLFPFARTPGPVLPGITPLFCSGSLICESITAALLLSRYNENRRSGFLLLALGSIYAALVAVAMLLTFPDALARNEPLVGGKTDLAAWVFQLWAWGAAAFPLAAAITEDRAGSVGSISALGLAPLALPLIPLAAGMLVGDPALVNGGQWTMLNLILTVGSYLAILATVAFILARLRRRDAVWLWVAASLTIFLSATFVSTYAGMRFAVGWSLGRVLLLLSNAGLLIYFITLFRDQQLELAAARDNLEARVAQRTAELESLLNELNHRVKNTLATVQSIVGMALRSSGVDSNVRDAIDNRILALSRAHNRLNRESWRSVTLREIIKDSVSPYADDRRLTLVGGDERIPPKSALAIAMAMHELATNATKYGALSDHAGIVSVDCKQGGGRIRVEWRESGGPLVKQPSRRGFGSKLLERSVAQDLAGEVSLRYEERGLVCILAGEVSTD